MKFNTSIVASLLASVAVARPRVLEDGDPLPEVSRITAFVIDKDGNPSVECWEISNLVETSQMQRADNTSATARALSLASSRELNGVDILTWPATSSLWPPSDYDQLKAESFNFANFNSLFSVQGGLIQFQFSGQVGGSSVANDKVETHIFSLENGDDWFYFEDDSSSAMSAMTEPPPFSISTISATETELLRLRYNQRPTHKVVHKGACKFTGIKVPAESSLPAGTARMHSPLTVQVTLEDSL